MRTNGLTARKMHSCVSNMMEISIKHPSQFFIRVSAICALQELLPNLLVYLGINHEVENPRSGDRQAFLRRVVRIVLRKLASPDHALLECQAGASYYWIWGIYNRRNG